MRAHNPRSPLLFLAALAVFCWWVRYHPPGTSFVVVDDDARQHVYWTARFQAPDLFRDDLLTRLVSSKTLDPIGYQTVYRLGVKFLDPLAVSRVLTLVLLLLSLWLLDLLNRKVIREREGRWTCGLLFLFFSLYSSSGGIPRSFAFPLLLGFLLLLYGGRYRSAVLCLFLEILVYPPIFLNCLMLAAWNLGTRWLAGDRGGLWKRDLAWLAGITLACAAVLFSVYGGADPDWLGPAVSANQARSMPEFQEFGRNRFFDPDRIRYFLFGRSGIGFYHIVGFLVILGIMGGVTRFKRFRFPRLSTDLICTSLFLFVLAHLFLFRLYLPSRYTTFTIPLALMIAIGANARSFREAFGTFGSAFRKRMFPARRFRGVGWVFLLLLLGVYSYVQGHVICRLDTEEVVLDREDLEMLSYLKGLPKDVLIAGFPTDMDNVPLLARRKVLVNQELSLAYHVNYLKEIRRRLRDLFDAYYASSWDAVERFVHRYGVGVLVVRKDDLRPGLGKGRGYHEPYGTLIRKRLRLGRPFALNSAPEAFRCFENARYLVLCFSGAAGEKGKDE